MKEEGSVIPARSFLISPVIDGKEEDQPGSIQERLKKIKREREENRSKQSLINPDSLRQMEGNANYPDGAERGAALSFCIPFLRGDDIQNWS